MDNLRWELRAMGLGGYTTTEDGFDVWVSSSGRVKITWLPGLQFYLVDPYPDTLRMGQTARDAAEKAALYK